MISPLVVEQRYIELQTRSAKPRDAASILGVVLTVALSLGIACLIDLVHHFWTGPEKATTVVAALFCLLLATISGVSFWRGNQRTPAKLGLTLLASVAVLLLGTYFYWVRGYVLFPADILIWSETDFVNDIVKLTVGYPLYTPQINNDAFNYVPGPQFLTYLLARVTGNLGSIPFYRLVQVVATGFSAYFALLCCRRILGRSQTLTWTCLQYAVLFLIASNPITSRFTHNLHGDALAQMASLAAFWLLLVYAGTRDLRVLAGMALVAPVGFLIRQSLVVWAVLFVAYLLFWDRDWKRGIAFGLVTGFLLALVLGACYLTWGDPFFYWTFRVLRSHAVSPLRSFQHMLEAWPYFAGGLLGGALVFRSRNSTRLLGVWVVGLALLAIETYTSGVAWMLNHMGPGTLIAGVWFVAGLQLLWVQAAEWWQAGAVSDWIGAGAAALSLVLFWNGMGLVRIPAAPLSADAARYAHDIEAQFRGLPPERVLLDVGAWNHVPARTVMGDRAPSIGERGFTGTGDFSGFLSRISARRYSKILVRNLDKPDLWYDRKDWPKPSGIRSALLANYRVTGRIKGAQPPLTFRYSSEDPYLFEEISILEPKAQE